jgi:hypothetical protein
MNLQDFGISEEEEAKVDTEVSTLKSLGITDEELNSTNDQVNIIPSQADIEQKRVDVKESIATQETEIQKDKEAAQAELENPNPTIAEPGLESSVFDPAALVLENSVGGLFFKGLGKGFDAIQMPVPVRKFMERMTPTDKDAYINTINFMDEQGMIKTDFLVQGSQGKDTAQFLSGENVFAVRDTFITQEKLKNDYFEMTNNIVNKLKAADIDPNDISTWRSAPQAQVIISGEVQKLRKAYKDLEGEAYKIVGDLAKKNKEQYKVDEFTKDLRKSLSEENIPEVAINAVNNVLNRFAKPFKDETAKLAALNKSRQALVVNAKKLKGEQRKALADGNTKLAEKLESKMEVNTQAIRDNVQANKDLRDIKYMNTEDLLGSVKLINSKLFKPGGTISMKDADELRGLQIAKKKLNEFIDSSVDNPALKKALADARGVTTKRSQIFGPKDTGGDKADIARMLDQGEYGKVAEFVTGPNAKENILYIRDTFGKDSTAYKNTFSYYLNDKLGLTVDKIGTILDGKKALGISGRVDIKAAADKIASLDAQDFAMIKQAIGEKEMLNLKSLRSLMRNYSDLESAASKYGRGITGGKLSYVEGEGNPLNMVGRGFKVVKDAMTYHMAKTAEKVVYNQPKFRTLTGASVGATIHLANNEDVTLEGTFTAMLFGGALGYGAGRVTRSALESDINKVSRYLREGKSYGKNMPKGIADAMGRLGEQAKRIEDEALNITKPTNTPSQTDTLTNTITGE